MDIEDTAIEDTIVVGGVSEVDAKLFIRLDHYQQEREGDITGRPDFKPVATCGSAFYPFKLEQRHPLLSTLPASPVDLFQLFLPISLMEGLEPNLSARDLSMARHTNLHRFTQGNLSGRLLEGLRD